MRRVAGLVLLLDLMAVSVPVYGLLFRPALLIEARNLLTTRVVDGSAILEASPAELREAGFKTDADREVVERWTRWMRRELPYLREPLPEAPVDRARELVLRFSRNGGGDCGAFDGLEDLLQRIGEGEGHGCCSDHSEALIALGHAAGLTVREVSNTRHVFNEFYVPEEQRWVWIDPQYALLAKGPTGGYLSLLELREAYLRDEPVEFEFFGTPYHLLHGRDPRTLHHYDEREDFADLWMLWGNNVFEENAFYVSLGLPRIAAQPLGLLLGRLPRPVMIRDGDSIQASAQVHRRRLAVGVATLLLGAPVGVLAWWLAAGHGRRSAGGMSALGPREG